MKYKTMKAKEEAFKEPNKDLDANEKTHLLEGENKEYVAIVVPTTNCNEEDKESQAVRAQEPEKALTKEKASFKSKLVGIFHLILEELTAPPTLGSVSTFAYLKKQTQFLYLIFEWI